MTTPLRSRLTLPLALAVALSVVCEPARAQSLARPLVQVVLESAIKDGLSGIAWNAMTEECRRIWAAEGVDVSWRRGREDLPPAAVAFPVLFDDRTVRRHDLKNGEAFGVTLFSGHSRRILVSAPRARQLVAAIRRGMADSDDALTLDIAVGRLLGRVLAHEIGHALLLTTRHATEGLMSPHLEAGAVGTLDERQFALSTTDRERLAMRFSGFDTGEPPRRADASVAAPALDESELVPPPRDAAAGITWIETPLPLPFPLPGPH